MDASGYLRWLEAEMQKQDETPWADSQFVVVWEGETPDSFICNGFDDVLYRIADDCDLDPAEVRKTLDASEWRESTEFRTDNRHIFRDREFVEDCGLTIIRIISPEVRDANKTS